MNDARKPRELDTRTAVQRPKVWMPAELLPEPDKKPGWAYRWVRTATLDKADPRNISKSMREGWEPESIEEQPSMQMLVDPNSRFKDNIEIGGLLLCKCPMELIEQRNAHFHNMTRAQTESVDNNLMRQSDPRMPLFQEKRSTSSFGKGA